MSRRFAYAIDKRYLPLLVPFGLRGSKDGVTLTDDGSLSATFGFFKIKTPLANVTEAHITRHYRWWTAFGVRGSMVDDGLSFGTNHRAGVCIHFADKVPSPLRRSGHSALTVTVADLEGLTSALGAGPGAPPERPGARDLDRGRRSLFLLREATRGSDCDQPGRRRDPSQRHDQRSQGCPR